MRIGVFDSGIGGLSTLLACLRRLPDAEYLFYGDTANAPYGDKDPDAVLRLTRYAYDWFIQAEANAVVLACNTATSAAVAPLRERAQVPIIGIEPAIKKALTLHPQGPVLLLATELTVSGSKLRDLLARLEDAEGRVQALACPGLAEMIEDQDRQGDQCIHDYLCRRVLPGLRVPPRAIVLGCTHYCWIGNALGQVFGPDVALVDGNDGVARQLLRRLQREDPPREAPELPPTARIHFHFTHDPVRKQAFATALLQEAGVRILPVSSPSSVAALPDRPYHGPGRRA